MLRSNALLFGLMAIVLCLSSHAAPMSGREGVSRKSFEELHRAGRRARKEIQDSLPRNAWYGSEYQYLGQFVDGGFPGPTTGWQRPFHENQTYDQLCNVASSAVRRLGGNPARAQELLERYGNQYIADCLLIEDEEYELAAAQHLLNMATKDAYKGI